MTDSRKKLDARGRRLLETLDQNTQVELLVRLESDLDPDQREALQQIGCSIRAGVGNVFSARITASRVPELAELPFVSSLQLSREVFDEDTKRS